MNLASKVNKTNCSKQTSFKTRHFHKYFSLILSSTFWHKLSGAVSGIPGGKVSVHDNELLSHEQLLYPTTSFEESSIEFEIQRDRNYYVEVRKMDMVSKPKLVKGDVYASYNNEEVKKEHKEESKTQ